MKKIIIYIVMAITVIVLQSNGFSASAKSEINKKNAETYCTQQSNSGIPCKVSATSGCGKGWTKAKKFRNGGNAWYACVKRETRSKASERNEQACKRWCDRTSTCEDCSQKYNCNSDDFEQIAKWTGKGDNWYACQRVDFSSHQSLDTRNRRESERRRLSLAEVHCDAEWSKKPSLNLKGGYVKIIRGFEEINHYNQLVEAGKITAHLICQGNCGGKTCLIRLPDNYQMHFTEIVRREDYMLSSTGRIPNCDDFQPTIICRGRPSREDVRPATPPPPR